MNDHPAWMRPDTEYVLERSGTPVDVDGYKIGEFTGHIICPECHRAANHIDKLEQNHAPGCENAPENLDA